MKNVYTDLYKKAVGAREFSYCKYSDFAVGSALLCENGEVFTGANIENGSYSLTICAERTAIFKAVSQGQRKFTAIAIAGGVYTDISKPCFPCGACLQVMSEFCHKEFKIVLSDGVYTLNELMPYAFKL